MRIYILRFDSRRSTSVEYISELFKVHIRVRLVNKQASKLIAVQLTIIGIVLSKCDFGISHNQNGVSSLGSVGAKGS